MKEKKDHKIVISCPSLLTVVLVAAKLWHVVAWSWWIVLLPVWFPIAVVLLLLLLAGLLTVLNL